MVFKKVLDVLKFPAIVFILFVISLFTGLYAKFPNADMIFHLAGGASIALAAQTLIRELQRNNKLGKIEFLPKFLFTVSLVSLIAVLWEFAEFLAGFLSPITLIGNLKDTLSDLACGLIGGAAIALLRNNS